MFFPEDLSIRNNKDLRIWRLFGKLIRKRKLQRKGAFSSLAAKDDFGYMGKTGKFSDL